MQTIQQLEDNIAQIKRQLEINSRTVPYNHEARRTLGASLMAHQRRLDDLLYQQAEEEADRIEAIREELLCAYGL
jgi:hypothetical protein